jgi:hypothetical protein
MTNPGDLLDSLQLDEEDVAPAAPSSDTPADAPPPAEPPADPAEASLPSEPVPPAPEVASAPAWTPTGKPFTFKVDSTEVAPEGALVTDQGILLPQAAWDQIRSQYLGNRDVWRRTQEHWQGQFRANQEQLVKAQQDAQVAQQFVRSLITEAQADPDKFVGRLDQIISTLPIREAEAKAAFYERREAERQQMEAAQAAEQQATQLEQSVKSFLGQQVESALGSEFKGLAADPGDRAELIEEMFSKHALEFFEGIDPSQAHLAAAQGWQMLTQMNGRLIGWYPDRLRSQLERRATRMKQWQDRWAKTAKVETRNQATVTAPPVTAPPAGRTPPRTPTGQFTKLSPKERAKLADKMLDDLTLDD